MKLKLVRGIQTAFRRIHVYRQYKDRLFRIVFHDREELLSLYHAVNGTEYTDASKLIIKTLNDVVYLGMKNDVAFLIACDLNLYEHQSTWNPNMPLRGLLYFADMLRGYIEKQELDIYSSTRISLPVPRYIIFYNGTKTVPDKLNKGFPLERAVDQAVQHCIDQDILSDILSQNRADMRGRQKALLLLTHRIQEIL